MFSKAISLCYAGFFMPQTFRKIYPVSHQTGKDIVSNGFGRADAYNLPKMALFNHHGCDF